MEPSRDAVSAWNRFAGFLHTAVTVLVCPDRNPRGSAELNPCTRTAAPHGAKKTFESREKAMGRSNMRPDPGNLSTGGEARAEAVERDSMTAAQHTGQSRRIMSRFFLRFFFAGSHERTSVVC